MGLFLQILGAIFLAILLLLVAGGLFLRFKVRSLLGALEKAASTIPVGAPSRIHLRELAAPSWEDDEAVTELAEALPGLGFAPIGLYQVEEMEGLGLSSWLNVGDRAYAVVYEHPMACVWVEFVTRYEDETAVTFTNNAEGTGLDQRPGFPVERFPELDLPTLYRKFLAERPEGPKKPPTADGFANEFVQAYADEMDWRNSRGGVSLDEIRAIGDHSGIPYDEDTLESLRDQSYLDAMDQLETRIREQFLASTELSAARWEDIRERLVVIHDKMTADYLEGVVSEYTEENGEIPQGSPRIAFAGLNARLRKSRRFEKIGEVSKPVEADLYVAPEYDD